MHNSCLYRSVCKDQTITCSGLVTTSWEPVVATQYLLIVFLISHSHFTDKRIIEKRPVKKCQYTPSQSFCPGSLNPFALIMLFFLLMVPLCLTF